MKNGEIVIVPFPFTDLSGQKVRPAYILSNKEYNKSKNIVVAAISSKPGMSKFAIDLSQADLVLGSLRKKSYVRLQNIFTLEKRLIQEKVGECSNEKKEEIKNNMIQIF